MKTVFATMCPSCKHNFDLHEPVPDVRCPECGWTFMIDLSSLKPSDVIAARYSTMHEASDAQDELRSLAGTLSGAGLAGIIIAALTALVALILAHENEGGWIVAAKFAGSFATIGFMLILLAQLYYIRAAVEKMANK